MIAEVEEGDSGDSLAWSQRTDTVDTVPWKAKSNGAEPD